MPEFDDNAYIRIRDEMGEELKAWLMGWHTKSRETNEPYNVFVEAITDALLMATVNAAVSAAYATGTPIEHVKAALVRDLEAMFAMAVAALAAADAGGGEAVH